MKKTVLLIIVLMFLVGCSSKSAPTKNSTPSPNKDFNTTMGNVVAGSGAREMVGRHKVLGIGFEPTCIGAIQTAAMWMQFRNDDVPIVEFDSSADFADAISGIVLDPNRLPSEDEIAIKSNIDYIDDIKSSGSILENIRKYAIPRRWLPAPQDGVFQVINCKQAVTARIIMHQPWRKEIPPDDPNDGQPHATTWSSLAIDLIWTGETWRVSDSQRAEIPSKFGNSQDFAINPATAKERKNLLKLLPEAGTYTFANANREWGKP